MNIQELRKEVSEKLLRNRYSRALSAILSSPKTYSGPSIEIPVKIANARFAPPSDGWYHIAPTGEHPHSAGVVQVIDKKSVDAMVSNFAKSKQDPKFPGALVDYDHLSQMRGHKTEAAGWIENLDGRKDGLWAQIKWSDEGEKAITGGRYKLVSPVWNRRDCEKIEGNKIRPLILDSVALTNEPNMRGLFPLTN